MATATAKTARYRLTCSDGQFYSESTSLDLFELIGKAHRLAELGCAVRVQEWTGGPVLFRAGNNPLNRWRNF